MPPTTSTQPTSDEPVGKTGTHHLSLHRGAHQGHDPHAKTMETFDRPYAFRIMALLAALVMITMYIEGMLTPSLLSIASNFNVDISQVSLVLSVYLVTGVALSPIAGKLGDVYGKKKVLTIVMVIYAAAVSVTGFSPTFGFMVVSRAVQGVGLTIMPLAMSLVREEFPRELVPKAQGLLSGLFGGGFAVSLPLGAWVSNAYGWRWTYHSAVPVVIALTIIAILFVRESPYRRPNAFIDYGGAAVLAGSLAMLVLALAQGPVWGWSDLRVVVLLAGGLLLLVPVAIIELYHHRKGRDVILNLRLLSERNVMVTNLVVLIAGFGMFLSFQAITYRLEDPSWGGGFGQSIFQTGLSFIAFAVPMLIFAPLASLAVTRVGTKPLTVLGGLIGADGFYMATGANSLFWMLVTMAIIGAGIAVLNASVINLLVLTVAPRDMGLGTSLNSVFRFMGSSVGAPLAASLMSTYMATYYYRGAIPVQLPDSTAFDYSYYIAAGAFLLSVVIALFAREILGASAVGAGDPTAKAARGPSSLPFSKTGNVPRPTARQLQPPG